MSYMALYRKFRPDTFEDVKGQDHIVKTLSNQINADRIGHAYLFCGTRGTGKTTIAKIFAKAVNCENPDSGNPCGRCKMCMAIKAQTSLNVIEIDAASNNGVDNIREIVEEVRYSPTEGRYKVYIIDEVHMLSPGAFNALLKTLEEPPSYVIFILATTEVHKIPITILSRCQRYDFKRITVENITLRMSELMQKENIEVEEKALKYIARAADGAMRDALSLLDQCLSFYMGGKLTYDNVLEVLGTVDVEVFAKLLRLIKKSSVSECIGLLDGLITAGRDLVQFSSDFVWYLRNLLMLQSCDDLDGVLDVSADQMELLKQEAAAFDSDIIIRYIRIFSELSAQLKYSSQKRVTFEVALVKLCRPAMEKDYESLINRISEIERQLEEGFVKTETKAAEPENKKTNVEPEIVLKALSEDLKAVAASWNEIVARTSPLIRTVLYCARPVPGNDNNLILLFDSQIDKDIIDKEEHREEIEKVILAVINREVAVTTKVINSAEESINDFADLTKIIKNVKIDYVD